MKWQRFLDSLDSGGGHLFVLGLGVLLGCALMRVSLTDGHTIIVGCGGALLAMLRPKAR